MPPATFRFPTTILFGAGALSELPATLARLGISRPLIVTDKGLSKSTVSGRVTSLLPDAPLFDEVEPNPTEKNVLDGVAAYREHVCDGLVGLGGGSPLDAAKAIRLMVTHTGPLASYDDLLDGADRISPDLPPYVAVATTSGTGSEVSRSTVITIAETNRKTVVFSPHLIPTVAIADPGLTAFMPSHITAGTGMDAFTHNVEAFLARGYHPMCDAIALQGARLVWDNLPLVMDDPHNMEARANMMMASIMGAVAFQKGLGAVHSLAHPLSSDCGMHHGTTNAVLLPIVIEYNRDAARSQLEQLSAEFGGGDPAGRVRDLNRRIGIKPRLRDYGVTEEILPKLADKAIQDGCHRLNPRPCSRADLLDLYRKAW